ARLTKIRHQNRETTLQTIHELCRRNWASIAFALSVSHPPSQDTLQDTLKLIYLRLILIKR
ncbi:MAG: hypothetical protein M3028_06990, partial [Bifidobacterium sp.]|nr:hypothetical protein [Bifidobacterium sp.]